MQLEIKDYAILTQTPNQAGVGFACSEMGTEPVIARGMVRSAMLSIFLKNSCKNSLHSVAVWQAAFLPGGLQGLRHNN